MKYKVVTEEADMILRMFIQDILIDHMSRRVGIENWPSEAIYTWLNYYFAADQIPKVITRAHDNLLRHRGLPKVKI